MSGARQSTGCLHGPGAKAHVLVIRAVMSSHSTCECACCSKLQPANSRLWPAWPRQAVPAACVAASPYFTSPLPSSLPLPCNPHSWRRNAVTYGDKLAVRDPHHEGSPEMTFRCAPGARVGSVE